MASKDLGLEINKHLFVPLDEELVTRLHEVAVAIAPTLNMELVSSCVNAFFQNKVSPLFSGKFRTKYSEMYGDGTDVPKLVLVVLETYVVLMAFKSDAVDNDTKAQFSLVVRNFVINRKGERNTLLCQNWIVEMYAYYNKCATKPFKQTVSYSKLLNAVVPKDNWSETGLEISDEGVFEQLRSLCVAGYRGKVSAYVEGKSFTGISSPFAQSYMLVQKMVKEWNWKYISSKPADKLSEVLGDKVKKRKMISNIVDDVNSEVSASDIFTPTQISSVLLKRVKEKQPSELDHQKLSALEFGVYLYYEMLLETYNC